MRSSENQQPTAVSLFSGAGGMDLGFTRAGFRMLFSNEMDSDAAATYCSNIEYLDPSVMHVGDVHDYLPKISEYRGADLVFGGPPCQGFSVAGKMDPADTRSELVFTFMNVVESIRPRVFVMENVRALAKLSKWQPVREKLFQRAEELGYGCCLILLNAADYGVPQARERMFLIGASGMPPSMVEGLIKNWLSEHRHTAPTSGEVLSSLPEYGSDGNPVTCTAAIHLAKHPILRRSPYSGSLLFNGRGRPMDLKAVAKTLPAEMGGNHTPIVNQTLLDNPSSGDWLISYHAALCAGTVRPETTLVPNDFRRLTVREAAALQTFPADYHFCGKTAKQYRQIGNAVPCRLAELVAEAVASQLLPRTRNQCPEFLSR